MSDFIYNDNFNNGDREPIQFNFGNKKGGSSAKAIALTCILCCIASVLFGCFIGLWFYNNYLGNEEYSQSSAPNVVYTNNNFVSAEVNPVISEINSENGETRADVIERIKDSVVEIRTESVVSFQGYIKSGAGSGVIVSDYICTDKDSGEVIEKGYYIITNAHVIDDAINSTKSKITVSLTDGTEYTAGLVGSDTISDIAVLKIKEEKKLTCAVFPNEEYNLRVGDEVIAIGNPLGQLGGTVTNGYVSALDREIEVDGVKMRLLQTDAPINPGNSGGGLFNLRGELIGIVNAKSAGTDIEGLGFAIPAKNAFKVYNDFVSLGYVEGRPTIFAEYVTYSNGTTSYATVTKVLKRDDGDNSSRLQVNDRIKGVIIDGERISITSAQQLDSIISSMEIGSELTLIVSRGFSSGTVTVTIYEYYI